MRSFALMMQKAIGMHDVILRNHLTGKCSSCSTCCVIFLLLFCWRVDPYSHLADFFVRGEESVKADWREWKEFSASLLLLVTCLIYPRGISNDLLWDGYGYFLTLHIFAFKVLIVFSDCLCLPSQRSNWTAMKCTEEQLFPRQPLNG